VQRVYGASHNAKVVALQQRIKSSFWIRAIWAFDHTAKSLVQRDIPGRLQAFRQACKIAQTNAGTGGKAMAATLGSETIGFRLAAIARRFPDRHALVEDGAALTFDELDAAALRTARQISTTVREQPGIVGLLFDSKLTAVAAIFGAARSGQAYVPLDVADPDDRLRFIVKDSEAVALLTEPALVERARALVPPGCAVIDITRTTPGDVEIEAASASADAPLYLFYTSGSTGQPKGVIQTHRNLLFFADAYARALEIGPADRVSLLYSLAFSAANMDIFGGLLKGATLCAYDVRRNGVPELADWLDRERITVLHAVPTVFRGLFGSLAPERKLTHLRAIDLGGEAVFDSDVELFRQHTVDRCILVNHLAATEASVIAQHRIERQGTPPAEGILPVGRCPDGLRVTVRRDDGSAAAAGEIGEIVVSSPHVSPGYWRRPDLDAAAFSVDAEAPEWRRYATGDLGRFDDAGDLHFLGRRGSRVKIRGHTVDLTEIEAALTACPGVSRAAVVQLSGDPGLHAERLVAYLAVDSDADRDALSIRRHLATRIPSYMFPRDYLFLDALPLTSSGKVDRRALASLALPDTAELLGGEPPRNDIERGVAAIFEELLKIEPIGWRADFFRLGGDSLSLVRLQAELRDTFGVAPANPYDDLTVGGIASAILRAQAAAPGSPRAIPVLVPLRQRGSAPPLYLVHGRLAQALVSPHFLDLLGDDQPVWAFQARGLDGMQEPHATIEAMAADYVDEIRGRQPDGPYFLGALCIGVFVALAMARRLRAAGEIVLPLLLLDPPVRPFAMHASRVTEDAMLARLQRRQAMGRIDAPIEDPHYARASVRTAIAFETAIREHRAVPYDGPVCILSSEDRLAGIPSSELTALFTGRVDRFDVATTHSEILDARNVAFVAALKRCLGIIHDYAKVY
jgi:amino acid adenylation domain-containing protein